MVFVGPSGCGKSTLLRLLAGLEEITSGTLSIGGTVVNGLSPQKRNVAMVFQDYALYPHMSVRRNLEFPLKMRRLPREQILQRVAWVADLLDLNPLLDRRPRQLSGGQRQRVAMGRALVRQPAVFLMDEPLSNLDAKLRVQIRAEIGELQRRTGTTMIYVTHDQAEAMTLGDRVAVLQQGVLQQVAKPQDLYERPGNVFVAGFIGNPPMNLFATSLFLGADGHLWMRLGDQAVPFRSRLLPEAQLGAWLKKPLTGGIRPEGFGLVSADAQSPIKVMASHVEYLGHETLLYFQVGGLTTLDGSGILVARLVGTHHFSKGQVVSLQSDYFQLQLFAASGLALSAAL
jgi:multiple sugar transport system ATP-binding protein